MGYDYPQEKVLIPKRIPLDQVELGKAYIIHARNGGVGIAVKVECTIRGVVKEQVNYTIRRIKFDPDPFLFDEVDWEEDKHFGTAIPLRKLEEEPPENRDDWLAWLVQLEETYKEEIEDTWNFKKHAAGESK